jgi:hypothetical protein
MERKFEIVPFSLSVASIWMLSPDFVGLRETLEERGYTVKGPDLQRTPDLLASKGTVEVYASTERRLLGVRSQTSLSDVIAAYDELMNINVDILGIDPTNIMFHEFIGDLTVSTGANPVDVLERVNQGIDEVRRIGGILGMDVFPISLRIAQKGGNPTSAKWLSLTIEPFYVSHDKRYRAQVVYREELPKMREFVKHLDGRLKQIFDELEKGSRA